ncbi:MAG: hypothetical protein V1794_11920 [Candidatus Glassbacteria bacterium]
MKVKILKTWIVRGRLIEPGTVIDLPPETAAAGISRELCRRTGRAADTGGRDKPEKPGDGEGE